MQSWSHVHPQLLSQMRTTCPVSDLQLHVISFVTLFDHGHNVLLLLRHHGDGSWFAVFADVPLSAKQK